MIGSVHGRLTSKQPPRITVECSGVGYEIETPMSTFLDLPQVGADVFLHTHLQVREDAHSLFGFATLEEKFLFRGLLRVSGVGARLALGILSGMSVADFQRCVLREDIGLLVKIPGVGRKTAERLIIEMRDRINQEVPASKASGGLTSQTDARGEAFDALVALGYKPNEVKRLLAQLDVHNKSAEDIIRSALRQAVG